MAAQQARFETVANNLANIDTPGFRRVLLGLAASAERPLYFRAPGESERRLLGTLTQGVTIGQPQVDTSQGPIQTTGRPLDVAILDDAFFSVSANGQTAYTRAGAIVLQSDGVLADQAGNPFLGKSGAAITVPQGTSPENVRIGAEGEVLVKQNTAATAQYAEIDRLQLARLDPQTVQPLGNRLYSGSATPVPAGEVRLQPEALEGANVNVVQAMADMIDTYRAYEANARCVQAMIDIEGTAIDKLR
jgi:flagellar basal-body rod protein FlgF